MKYAKLFSKKQTPQSQPIPGSGQIRNSGTGHSWGVDRWTMLDRFLILGSEDGTFFIGERKLTLDHAKNALACLKQDGERFVNRLIDISESGRAPKNDPAIFALALASAYGDDATRAAALLALPRVCRTGTHLFSFAAAVEEMRGWGRGLRKAIGRWYNDKPVTAIEYQVAKYGQRGGWSHRDLLRLAHPKPPTELHRILYKWIVDGELQGDLPLVRAMLTLQEEASVADKAELIRGLKVPREAIPTELLTEKLVWDALLDAMPMTALVRNLGNLSKCGLVINGSEAAGRVVAQIDDVERLRKARLHPLSFLNALVTYAGGRGMRGKGEWPVATKVVDALDRAFYAAFANVEPTGQRLVVGLDVSGSMAGTLVAGMAGMDCRKACGAMALVNAATEPNVTCVAFDTRAYPLAISARQRLDDVVNLLAKTGGGGTDCAIPITYAIEKRIEADAFVIYTDSETWYGAMHPAQAIEKYREIMGIPAKLIVVAMAANKFSVGGPKDAGTLNVVGFDTAVPQVIGEFLRG